MALVNLTPDEFNSVAHACRIAAGQADKRFHGLVTAMHQISKRG
jgi:hypothetical protein